MGESSENGGGVDELKRRLEGLAIDFDDAGRAVLRGQVIANRDLSGLDLSGYDLSGADLSGSDLSNANLAGADLTETKLCRTQLDGTEFLNACLLRADLAEARGENCGFAHADLREVNAVGARLTNSSWSEARFDRANFGGAVLEGGRFRGANLSSAEFVHANLSGCDLEEATLDRTSFHLADLHGCRLSDVKDYKTANWIGVNVLDVDFHGAYLVRRHLMDENYLHEFRRQSRFSAVLYWIWWATSDCGRSLLRWTVWVGALIVAYGMAYMVVDVDFGDHETAFSPIYYSVSTLTTMGYGGAAPASLPAQLLAVSETLLGYVGLGGLLSIFVQKMARRAE